MVPIIQKDNVHWTQYHNHNIIVMLVIVLLVKVLQFNELTDLLNLTNAHSKITIMIMKCPPFIPNV